MLVQKHALKNDSQDDHRENSKSCKNEITLKTFEVSDPGERSKNHDGNQNKNPGFHISIKDNFG